MKILVIGGGLFGTSAAITLSDKDTEVDLVEVESDIMELASKVNHNRIHLGYHYLRSIATAEQSIEGMLSFLFNYGDAVVYQFPNYYAIAKENSRTSPEQFINFCDKVGIGYEEEFPESNLLCKNTVEACFRVPEPVWDYDILKGIICQKLKDAKVNVFLNTRCDSLKLLSDQKFEAKLSLGTKHYDVVINSTYSNINFINSYLGVTQKKLLYEDVIVPKFKYPARAFGITVMDGPFCSVMPHGKVSNEFLLYHVKESVIQSQIDFQKPAFAMQKLSDFDLMKDGHIYDKSAYFMPFLKNVIPNGYGRTIRTVYENSDDARLTELFIPDKIDNYFTILSGKVTTCMQVALEIKHILKGKQRTKRFII